MRALICKEYGTPERLEVRKVDEPVPGDRDILIDVSCAGINFPDLLVIAGKYQVKTPTPFVPGNEVSGIVAAVGDSVTRFRPGDRVVAYQVGGAFAERFVVDEGAAAPLPKGLDFRQGAGFMVTFGTSYHALRQSAGLKPQETVLVLGAAGGVGIAAVQLAKAMGAHVIAAASSSTKTAFALAAGADDVIDYSSQPLREIVRELTAGKGVDVVCDPVGGELANQALRSLAWHGRHLVIGFAGGDIPSFPANIALLKEASIVGVWWGTWVARNPQQAMQNVVEMGEMIDAGKLSPGQPEVYAFEDFVDAFAAISERRVLGKVVLEMSPE